MSEALVEYYDKPDTTPRLKSFGKFKKDYVKEYVNDKGQKSFRVEAPFDIAFMILKNFHPKVKPVLWRILVAQLYIYNAIQSAMI